MAQSAGSAEYTDSISVSLSHLLPGQLWPEWCYIIAEGFFYIIIFHFVYLI